MPDWTDTYITATEAQTAVRGVYPFQRFAWVARILGLHREYNFERRFLNGHRRLRPCPDDPDAVCGTIHWWLEGPGIYQYRGFVTGLAGGDGSDSWFFEVTESGLQRPLWEHQVTDRFTDFEALVRHWEEVAERARARKAAGIIPHRQRDDDAGHYH